MERLYTEFRGALNAVLQLTPEQRAKGVCTFSAGNHGQGLAYAAQLSGVHCTVFMARDANPLKIEAIRGYGADLVFKGGMQVYTTLSPVMQVKAERSLRDGLKALESRRVAAVKDKTVAPPERPELP
jgi:threonine dehydratase